MKAFPTLALIVNSGAGRVRPSSVARVREELARRFLVTVHVGSSPDEVARLARQAAHEAEVVVAFGGDGTASRVAAGVVGSDAVFSALPGGSTNHVARLLGFPADPVRAARLLAGPARFRFLDVGRVDAERILLFLGGTGIDVAIVRDAPPSAKRFFAWRTYLVPGLRHLLDGPWPFTVEVDGIQHVVRARSVLLANGSFLVHPYFRLGPAIDPSDGVLDVLILHPPHLVGWLELFAWTVLGRLWRSRYVSSYRGRRVVVRAATPVPAEIDGDSWIGITELAVTVEPRALRTLVPAFVRGVGE